MHKIFLGAVVLIFILALFSLASMKVEAATYSSGDLIKGESFPSVYYFAENGMRYVFPNEKTYFTWYENFDDVITIPDAELGSIMIGGNVTYKPGYKMMKITTSNKVYAVEGGGVIRWIKTQEAAETLYGTAWNNWIDDVPDAFFTNYREGTSIEFAADYDKNHQATLFYTINHDKGFVYEGL